MLKHNWQITLKTRCGCTRTFIRNECPRSDRLHLPLLPRPELEPIGDPVDSDPPMDFKLSTRTFIYHSEYAVEHETDSVITHYMLFIEE